MKTQYGYMLDLGFFNEPSPERDYFLGLWWADGCLQGNSVQLSATRKDKPHLLRTVRPFSSHPVYDYDYESTVCWRACSVELAAKIRELGGTERKSRVIDWPHWLTYSDASHFVRGVFDGDGFARITCRTLVVGFSSGSDTFVNELQACVNQIPGVKSRLEHRPSTTVEIRGKQANFSDSYQLRLSGPSAEKLGEWMYRDAGELALGRKQEIFQERERLRAATISKKMAHRQEREKLAARVNALRGDGMFCKDIAVLLNDEGLVNSRGGDWSVPWTPASVSELSTRGW
jgi:hypothetical protein